MVGVGPHVYTCCYLRMSFYCGAVMALCAFAQECMVLFCGILLPLCETNGCEGVLCPWCAYHLFYFVISRLCELYGIGYCLAMSGHYVSLIAYVLTPGNK